MQTQTGECEALYEFAGDEEAGELSFVPGNIIVMLEKVNDEWMKGRKGAKEGIFPLNFVKVTVEIPTAATPKIVPAKSTSQGILLGYFILLHRIYTLQLYIQNNLFLGRKFI